MRPIRFLFNHFPLYFMKLETYPQLILKRGGMGKFHWISSPADHDTPLDRQIFTQGTKRGLIQRLRLLISL